MAEHDYISTAIEKEGAMSDPNGTYDITDAYGPTQEYYEERIARLEDQLRAKQIDVNSAALSDANKRIAELEAECESLGQINRRHVETHQQMANNAQEVGRAYECLRQALGSILSKLADYPDSAIWVGRGYSLRALRSDVIKALEERGDER